MDLSQGLECNRARAKWKSQARLSRVGRGASENTFSSALLKCYSKGSEPGPQQGYHPAKQEGKEQSMGLSIFKPSLGLILCLRHSLWEMEEWKLRCCIGCQKLPPAFRKSCAWSPNSMFDGPWSKETHKFTGPNLRKCHYTFFQH